VEDPERRPDPVERPVMRMRWADLTFLHWRYRPDDVQRLLPPGLEVETFDGAAWVGLVPFVMTVRAARGPAVPWVSFFPETNVRTYVRGPDGRTGIWFFSLDAARLPAVLTARAWYGLPYMWSVMGVRTDGERARYRCARRWPDGGPRSAVETTIGDPLPRENVTELEDFLTARFRLYSRVRGRLRAAPADHAPWPLHRVEDVRVHDELVGASGLPAPDGDPLAVFSPGVDVSVGAARDVPAG
jgi:uncharacterized protein